MKRESESRFSLDVSVTFEVMDLLEDMGRSLRGTLKTRHGLRAVRGESQGPVRPKSASSTAPSAPDLFHLLNICSLRQRMEPCLAVPCTCHFAGAVTQTARAEFPSLELRPRGSGGQRAMRCPGQDECAGNPSAPCSERGRSFGAVMV